MDVWRIHMSTIAHLRQIQSVCTDNNDVYFFLLDSNDITQNYTQLLNKKVSSSFSSNQLTREKISRQQMQYALFYQFLLCCRAYVTNWKELVYDGDLVRKSSHSTCTGCGTILVHNNFVCTVCGTNQEQEQKLETNNTNNCRMNMMNKYTYERLTNFKDLMSKLQGKQQSKIPCDVYNDLISMIEKHHQYIEDCPNKKIRYKNVTATDILNYLKELKLKKYYKDAALIHYNITGTKPFSITEKVEKAIMSDYVEMLNLYNRYKKQGRRSFLNSQYLFCKLLSKHRIKININEFAHLKTRDRVLWHDEMYDKMAKDLGWS